MHTELISHRPCYLNMSGILNPSEDTSEPVMGVLLICLYIFQKFSRFQKHQRVGTGGIQSRVKWDERSSVTCLYYLSSTFSFCNWVPWRVFEYWISNRKTRRQNKQTPLLIFHKDCHLLFDRLLEKWKLRLADWCLFSSEYKSIVLDWFAVWWSMQQQCNL